MLYDTSKGFKICLALTKKYQTEIALESGVAAHRLSNLKKGRGKPPSFWEMKNVSEACGIDIHRLIKYMEREDEYKV